MKHIIINIEDMTDSTEIYNSKPASFIIWFIYIIFVLLISALIWMNFFNIDIFIKADGLFRYDKEINNISIGVSGKIKECTIEEGKFVKKGEKLFVIDNRQVARQIKEYKDKMANVDSRIKILKAYQKWLNGDNDALNNFNDNKYYNEFDNRKKLLKANINLSNGNVGKQRAECKKSIRNFSKLVKKYKDQISKLEKAKKCVEKRKNKFGKNDLYYKSMVDSYISGYELSVLQYNDKIQEYHTQLEELREKDIFGDVSANENKKQIQQVKDSIRRLKKERKNGLEEMELQQISVIEQQIETTNSSLVSANSSVFSARIQLGALDGKSNNTGNEISVMTEMDTVSNEIDTYKEQRNEIQNSINNLELQNSKYVIKADATGYINIVSDVKNGMYVQEGTSLCQILPEGDCGYYAEVFIGNTDVAKLKKGQEVKFEIPAYPSSEYGYFNGKIDVLSKDIKVDSNTGIAYYLAKVKCNKNTVINKKGKEYSIINGMECQAKIVTGRKSIMEYVLDKIAWI